MEKTVAVRLKGGLGNQLFQYAAGRSFANSRNKDFVLLTDFLKRPSEGYTTRQFDLEQFGLHRFLANEETEKRFTETSFFKKLGLLKKPLTVTEANFFSVKDSGQLVILDGYFQSEKYFASIRSELVSDLKNAFTGDAEFRNQLKAIQEKNSVAVHVRRGDYVSLASAARYHGALDISYFKKAIDYIKQKEREPRFFVFSDDTEWCIQNFPASEEFVFPDSKSPNSGTDLLLMSGCKHQVISNSSYSWWSAWLNENPGKIVIAPNNWFSAPNAGSADVYCKDWIRF